MKNSNSSLQKLIEAVRGLVTKETHGRLEQARHLLQLKNACAKAGLDFGACLARVPMTLAHAGKLIALLNARKRGTLTDAVIEKVPPAKLMAVARFLGKDKSTDVHWFEAAGSLGMADLRRRITAADPQGHVWNHVTFKLTNTDYNRLSLLLGLFGAVRKSGRWSRRDEAFGRMLMVLSEKKPPNTRETAQSLTMQDQRRRKVIALVKKVA